MSQWRATEPPIYAQRLLYCHKFRRRQMPRTVSRMTDFGNSPAIKTDIMEPKFGFILKTRDLQKCIPEPR